MARIFITGSTEGLGLAAARSLIADGHKVVLHARSAARATQLGDLDGSHAGIVIGDLSSAEDTLGIARQVNDLGRFDAIIHNAGIYTTHERGETTQGHATILAVNTLAPYMLTALIDRPARLVYLSSALHRAGEGSLDDLDWRSRPWDAARAYAESKLQMAALAFAVSRRWPEVLSNAVDPGWVRTRMGGASAPVDLVTGQRTQSWLAASDDRAALVSGRYWRDLREDEPAPEVRSEVFQDRLVARLQELTSIALP